MGGQRYVPAPGYERRYGAKDVNEWPSKKVYGEKTPRPTKWTPPKYGKGKDWMKPTPKPTKYIKTPKPTKDSYNSWPSKKDVRTYSDEMDLTQLEKILLADDPEAAIEEQLIIHGEDGEDRLFCDYFGCGCWALVVPRLVLVTRLLNFLFFEYIAHIISRHFINCY